MNFTKDFQQILIDFFTKYDEKNLKTVPEIIKRFRQNKEQVILHLCNRYNVDINTIEGVETSGSPSRPVAAPAAEAGSVAGDAGTPVQDAEAGSAEASNVNEAAAAEEGEAPPKKKSKILLIVIIIVVVVVLGGGGYFAYDMFIAGGDSHTEEAAPADTAAPAATPVAEPEPEPEPAPAAADTAAADSSAVESAEGGNNE